jgi:CRP-like cAMP-binding protein
MTGNDGLVGLPIILHVDLASHDSVVQIAGDAFRVPADILRAEFRRHAPLHVALLQYTHAFLAQLSQSVVCHRFHAVLQRLSRWLLVAQDRAESETLLLTHESIAHVLGIPRNRVTAAAVALQDAGVIRYRHGKIGIVNRRRLEAEACECYWIGRDDRF